MTARIAGFVTRADAGLAAPRSVSTNIDPSKGGVTVHYGGPAQGIDDHADCIRTWRAWQNYHMGTRGYVDIAYTGGFCDHGYAFAGRGAGVRTGANGTNDGNAYWYAVCWIGGQGETPTPAALDAADWWVEQLRKVGAADRVVPHSWHKSTGCPGLHLTTYAADRDGQPLDEEEPIMAAPILVKKINADGTEAPELWQIVGRTRSHISAAVWRHLIVDEQGRPVPLEVRDKWIHKLPHTHEVWNYPVLEDLGGPGTHRHEATVTLT